MTACKSTYWACRWKAAAGDSGSLGSVCKCSWNCSASKPAMKATCAWLACNHAAANGLEVVQAVR